jgi:hypothetical protein
MKTYCFGLNYLGGRVDLPRFRQNLGGHYPESSLVIQRGEKVLVIPLVKGELALPEGAIPYEATAYQFESGFGVWVAAFESKGPVATILDNPAFVFTQPAFSQAVMDFLKRSFGVENLANLHSLLRHKDGIRDLQAATGVEVAQVGLEDANLGLEFSEATLVVGPSLEAMDMGAALDVSRKGGEVFALGSNRLWARAMNDALLWDLIQMFLREQGVTRLKHLALHWMEQLQRQLAQMQASLAEENEAVWAQDREDVERLDLRFHLFSGETRRFLVRGEFLWLDVIEREKWNALSLFKRQKELIHETLEESGRSVERMTRPLDFREFKLLKSGVEEVEARIMLLTVLLVLMELFAQALVPGHWVPKGILLLLIIAIPGGYLLFERWRKQETLRKGRAILVANRKQRVEADIRTYELELERLQGAGFLSGEVRDTYEREMKEIIARLKEKKMGYESELKNRL